MNTLEAFHMRCQRQILDVRWWAHVSNAEVLQGSGLSTNGDILHLTQSTLISGHIACLDDGVPAHYALRLMMDTHDGRKPMASYRKPPGRPYNKVQEYANAVLLSTLWRCEIARGHGAAQRFTRTTVLPS